MAVDQVNRAKERVFWSWERVSVRARGGCGLRASRRSGAGSESGSIIVETVFSWPGSGSLLISAITSRDYPLITGTVLTYTMIFVIINFTIDILYATIDPRIRFDK